VYKIQCRINFWLYNVYSVLPLYMCFINQQYFSGTLFWKCWLRWSVSGRSNV